MAGKILSAVSQLSRRQDELDSKLEAQASRIDDLDSQSSDQTARIEDLDQTSVEQSERITSVEAKLHDQEGRLTKLESSTTAQPPSEVVWPDPAVQVVSEVTRNINERLERQKNAIIFNVQESNSNIKDEIIKADIEQVTDLCRYLVEEDLRFTTKRLGKRVRREAHHENGRTPSETSQSPVGAGDQSVPLFQPRPMLVQLDSAEAKAKVMKRLYRLGHTDVPEYFTDISVKHDMTPAERENEKELRREVREKNESREDLNLKYKIAGPPWDRKIITVEVREPRGPSSQENVRPMNSQQAAQSGEHQ